MTKRLLLATAVLVLSVVGCGDGSTGRPVDASTSIGMLRGLVTGDLVAPTNAVRVVLVWYDHQGRRSYATQETDIAPQFPARFTMSVKDPPPESALRTIAGFAIRRATGHFVVYEDRNGNGRFDLIPEGGEQPIDRLLSDSDDGRIAVEYYEGTPEDLAAASLLIEGHPAVPGLNLYRLNASPRVGNGCVDVPCHISGPAFQWIAPDAEIELPIYQPSFSFLQCAQWTYESKPAVSADGSCPGGVVPAGWGTICTESDAGYPNIFHAMSPHTADEAVCTFSTQMCLIGWTSAEPLPADWPCH